MLNRMLDIVLDLKEKAYDQVHRTQLAKIPISDLLRRARYNIPEILSTESFLVNKIETKKTRRQPATQSFDQPTHRIDIPDRNSASLSNLFRLSDQESSQKSPGTSIQPNVTEAVRVPSDIIEDRTEYDLREDAEKTDSDDKDLYSNETEEKSDDENITKD